MRLLDVYKRQVLLIICILWEKLRDGRNRGVYRLMRAIALPDLFAVIMGLCAMGLILIPELVYVRDIYENGNARANTMFKLTYQAYILDVYKRQQKRRGRNNLSVFCKVSFA